MTDEQINIAVAKACGWKLIEDDPNYEPHFEDPDGYKIAVGLHKHRIPNYSNDLNAIHEAEKTLSEEQWENHNFILCNLVGGYSKTNKEAIHASSRQKAEAFLEAIIYKNNS